MDIYIGAVAGDPNKRTVFRMNVLDAAYPSIHVRTKCRQGLAGSKWWSNDNYWVCCLVFC